MNINFESIEKAWFKPKKTVLDELEEWVKEQSEYDEYNDLVYRETMSCVLDKIQELKNEVK